jgi:hypothetical protein
MKTQAQIYFDFDTPTAQQTLDRSRAIKTRNESAKVSLETGRRNKRLMDVLRVLAEGGLSSSGKTRNEVAIAIGCKDTGVCQAFIDCVAEGLVETTGERRKSDSDRLVDVYRLTGRGHRVLIAG